MIHVDSFFDCFDDAVNNSLFFKLMGMYYAPRPELQFDQSCLNDDVWLKGA